MSRGPSQPDVPNSEGVQQILADVERYAGWLGKDVRPTRLRDNVKRLALAIANGEGVFGAMQDLQSDIDGLSSGGVTPLLRQTMRKLRAELGEMTS